MTVETDISLAGPVIEFKGTENLSALPEFFAGTMTETELAVGEMVSPGDPVTVFSSAYSPAEIITELPQREITEARSTSWLEGIIKYKKEVSAVLILATQTAFSGASFGVGIIGGGMIGRGIAEFIKPLFKHGNDKSAAGCVTTVGGAVIGGLWGESVKIAQVLPLEAMLMMALGLGGLFGIRSLAEKWLVKSQDIIPLLQPKLSLKVEKGKVKTPSLNLKVQKGEKPTGKMKVRLKDE